MDIYALEPHICYTTSVTPNGIVVSVDQYIYDGRDDRRLDGSIYDGRVN